MTAGEQSTLLSGIMQNVLQEGCTMDVLNALTGKITEEMEVHEKAGESDILIVSGQDLAKILQSSGVSAGKAEAFSREFEDVFGKQTAIPAVNVTGSTKCVVTTPGVSIQVSPDKADLVTTRVIDGIRCITIVADGTVEVNGVAVAIQDTN